MNQNPLTTRLKSEQRKSEQRKIVRFRVDIRGIVQGVGFRPFIYSLAKKHSLKGFVLNNTTGVKVEVEGERALLHPWLLFKK